MDLVDSEKCEVMDLPTVIKSEELVFPVETCPFCNSHFNSEQMLMQHIHSNHEMKIETEDSAIVKDEVFREEPDYVYPEDLVNATNEPTQFKCDDCGKVFKTIHTLTRHQKSHKEKRIKCHLCDKVYKFKCSLDIHIESCHKPNFVPWECKHCYKCFTAKNYLNVHLRTHKERVLHNCPYCDKAYVAKDYLQVHIRNKHTSRQKSTNKVTYPCSVCKKNIMTEKGYERHMKTFHLEKQNYICFHCNRSYDAKSYLRVHILREHFPHLWKYTCKVCNKKEHSANRLNLHMQLHSNRHQCKYCNKTYESKSLLNAHLVCHEGYKVRCKHCSRTFIDKDKLKSHILTKHTD